MSGQTSAPPESAPTRTEWLWLIAGLAVLLLFQLGGRGLNEPDEGRYSNIALEMLEPGHGWLEPRMSDFGHYDKPPLTYWVAALSFQAFGRHEAAARLPSLLGACAALVGIGWAGWRLYGPRVAWWAVLMTATLGQFWLLARFLSPDMLLTGFTTLGLAAWLEARHRQASWLWWGVSLAAWSVAWLAKATAALIPLLGITVALLVRRDREGLRALRPVRMLLAIVALGLPWYLEMVREHPALLDFFLGRELVGRIAGHPDGRKAPMFFHVLVTLGAWLPWWPTVLGVLAWRARGRWLASVRETWRTWPVELWIVLTGLTVFSLISSKLPTYTLPYAPWAALFCAATWLRLANTLPKFRDLRPRLVTAGAFGLAYLAVACVQPLVEDKAGRNSSVRKLAARLHSVGADTVYLDRYWPGMEFYFGERTLFVLPQVPQQRSDDPGYCPVLGEPHFVTTNRWLGSLSHHLGERVWLVSLRQTPNTPLLQAASLGRLVETNRVGDFVLWRFERATTARH